MSLRPLLASLVIAATPAQAGVFRLSEEAPVLEQALSTLSAETCVPVLEGLYQRLEAVEPGQVDRYDAHLHGAEVIQEVYLAQVQMHETLGALVVKGELSADCVTSWRRADLAARYLVDEIYEALPQTRRPSPWLGVAGPEGLRSGDVLVTRGEAVSSAGIAHMGKVDSQFSHNAMVYIDPTTGEAWTIEAYLEQGALVEPLDHFLEHGLGRIVVARYQDPALAHHAAELAFHRVQDGPPIDYDEDFSYEDHGELFCSEIAGWAFELAGGPGDIPAVHTAFDQERNGQMFAAMGIELDQTTAPADLLFDGRFHHVGEWRDVEGLQTMRRHDAVVESLFQWMEEGDYVLEAGATEEVTVSVGLAVRRTPGIGQVLKSRIHPHGDPVFLVASLGLQRAALGLDATLKQQLVGRTDPMTYNDLRDALETLRVQDLAVWRQNPRRAVFHQTVHPAR